MNDNNLAKKLFGKDYQEFTEQDPFNPMNSLSGFISRKSNEYYGALLITKINGKTTEQLIMGTPKMHYPFTTRQDGSRKYEFPIAKNVEVYEKLDGTNILTYTYKHNGKDYITFKTRLRPFVASGRFGNFYEMWQEVGIPHIDQIKTLMETHKCNLSFEIYGARNPHLIMYPNSLDIALLFGVTNTGRIISPSQFTTSLPTPPLLVTITAEYQTHYENIQKQLQDGLKQEDEGYYSGQEGTVWYLTTIDGRCVQLKCKPETIEAIHFSAGCGINKNVLLATCWNAFENVDKLTVDFIKQLLLEEFPQHVVEANHALIQKSIAFVEAEAEFRQKVIEKYRVFGKNILLDKVKVMRHMSQLFNKKDMRKVHSIITNLV